MTISASSSKTDTIKNPLGFVIPSSKEETIGSFISEPPQEKDKISFRKYQVLISFSISDKLLAFLGPYHTLKSCPEKGEGLFPCFLPTKHDAFKQHMLDLKFLDPYERVFRSAPTLNRKEYIAWLDRVQS